MSLGKKGFVHSLGQQTIRLIVDSLTALVLDGLSLNLKLLLGYRIQQEAHAVGFEPKHFLQLIGRHSFEIVGAIGVGRTVHRAAGLGDNLDVLFVCYVLGSLKHHMFEEMRKPGFSDLLSTGPDMVGHINVH